MGRVRRYLWARRLAGPQPGQMPPLVDGLPTIVGGTRPRRAVPWTRAKAVRPAELIERNDHELQRQARRPQEEARALAGAARIRARRLEGGGRRGDAAKKLAYATIAEKEANAARLHDFLEGIARRRAAR